MSAHAVLIDLPVVEGMSASTKIDAELGCTLEVCNVAVVVD